MDHAAYAKDLFEQGYNCAQAVFAAFADETGMDQETALKLSSSFGGGIGRLREVCGAVSGMAMAAGMLYGNTDPKDKDAKAAHYQLVQELVNTFKADNDSIICRDLIGIDADGSPIPNARTKEYYESRPCSGLVESAARILDDFIRGRKEAVV